MTWPLQSEFKAGGPVSQVPREWFEDVANILNHLGGVNCRIDKTALPSVGNPWKIIVDLSESEIESLPLHPAGTAGYVLTSNGVAAPTWQEVSGLPAQTGNDGKFLKTDGSVASCADVNEMADGTATGQIPVWNHTTAVWDSLAVGAANTVLKSNGTTPSWSKILPANIDGTQASGGPTAANQSIMSGTLSGGVWTLAWGRMHLVSGETTPTGLVWWDDTNEQLLSYASILGRVPYSYLNAGEGGAGRMILFDADGNPSLTTYAGASGTATGQIRYWNNTTSAWVLLNIGSTDHVLTVASGTPAWASVGSKAFPSGGSTSMVLQKSSATDYVVEWDWVRTV